MNIFRRNIILSLVLVACIVSGWFLIAQAIPIVQASFLGTIWDRMTTPFAGNGTSSLTEIPAKPTELYRPAVDYEQAVVAAVKKEAKAVVAITVSKNLPVLENCPIDPFADLPPEMRQFFGKNFQIQGQCERGTKLQEVGGGSGFIITTDGLIVTNKHVVSDAKASYTVLTNDGKKYDAKVLARDPVVDLAIVKVNVSGLPIAELGDSDTLELGQTAIAIGNALAEFRNTVSVGVISGLARTVTASGVGFGNETISGVIQTDAAINPGNSGGPLLNLRGEVIGINTAVVSDAQSIGFAIPINQAKRAIASVKATGEIQASYLGVRYALVTPDIAEEQKLPVADGALVRGTEDGPAVEPNSPAAKAGIMAEDIITAVNGKKVTVDTPLVNLIAEHGVGETVTLKVFRGGKELSIQVILAKRPTK